MRIENTNIDGSLIKQEPLTFLMQRHGFVLGSAWDYERVTFDYKMETPELNVTYYIRISGVAVEGDVDAGNAVIKLKTPLLGKHYYPHGVEYGDEDFPEEILSRTERIITKVTEAMATYFEEEESPQL